MSLIAAITCNKVVYEAQESYRRRSDAIGGILSLFGLSWPGATAVMDPASKSLAVYYIAGEILPSENSWPGGR